VLIGVFKKASLGMKLIAIYVIAVHIAVTLTLDLRPKVLQIANHCLLKLCLTLTQ